MKNRRAGAGFEVEDESLEGGNVEASVILDSRVIDKTEQVLHEAYLCSTTTNGEI